MGQNARYMPLGLRYAESISVKNTPQQMPQMDSSIKKYARYAAISELLRKAQRETNRVYAVIAGYGNDKNNYM